ncbi:MAG: M4 family metallopeptidase [Clostridiales Family XIII bacterium]|jgi:Zn-dependent metalloprotease|nr:M4 family metallopeptidase [Clostridiales Family XIII bacterium]
MKRNLKKALLMLLVVAMAAAVFPPASAAENTYGDVPESHWAYDAVAAWSQPGNAVLHGYGDGNFGPGDGIKDVDLSLILARILGQPEPAWANSPVISREQAAEKIAAALGISPLEQPASRFADDAEIAAAYKPHVYALKDRGYVSGIGDNLFAPKKSFTRAEIAQILYNAVSALADADINERTFAEYLVIRAAGLTVKNSAAKDIIAGGGNITLDAVSVSGNLLVYGNGDTSVRIAGSEISSVTLAKNGIRLAADPASKIPAVIVSADVSENVVVDVPNTTVVNNSKTARVLDKDGGVIAEPGKTEKTDANGKKIVSAAASGGGGGGGGGGDGGDVTPETKPNTPGPDNLADSIIDLGDLEELVASGTIEVIRAENGNIRVIDGPFTDKTIRSAQNAAAVLNSAISLFGGRFFVDSTDITAQRVEGDGEAAGENIYCYAPSVGGLSVLGSQIILVADDAGAVQGLFSSYDARILSVDTGPTIEAQAASAAATNALLAAEELSAFIDEAAQTAGTGAENIRNTILASLHTDVSLLIYGAGDETPQLAYAVKFYTVLENTDGVDADEDEDNVPGAATGIGPAASVPGSALPTLPYIEETFYIYANGSGAGNVLAAISHINAWSNAKVSALDLNETTRTLDVQYDEPMYRLRDAGRNIETYRTAYDGSGLLYTSELPGDIVTFSVSSGIDRAPVSAHANLAHVYDYYNDVLLRDSFDNSGAKIISSIDYDATAWWPDAEDNAFWSSRYGQILFGNAGNYEAALDVVGHEFTHAVIEYIVPGGDGLLYRGESGALEEAYADILGSIIEGKNDAGRWALGEDSDDTLRDMSSPSSYDQPEHYDDLYTGFSDSGGVHKNSGIFSFAAYKMMTDGRTAAISDNVWAKVFYRSLFRLAADSVFLDARGAVVSAAKGLGFTSTQQQAIKDAFDAVGIVEPDSIRIVLRWGESPYDLDSHLIGPTVTGEAPFHIYYSQRDYYANGAVAADLDYDDTTSYGPEITTIRLLTPGEYAFYVHDYTNRSADSSSALAGSGAYVTVYRGSGNQALYTANIDPANDGTLWNAFRLTLNPDASIDVTAVNTYSYHSYPDSVGQ